ncbi:MAG: arginase family protein, partial [Planctomycetota bacterium]
MANTTYEIIGAPFDLGSPVRGCAEAPEALRKRGLVRWLQSLAWEGVSLLDGSDAPPQEVFDSEARPKHLRELLAFSKNLMDRLDRSYASGHRPIVLGGDHSISIASFSAAVKHLRSREGEGAELGLLWIDAHPDLETPEESPQSDLHGTPVAHLLGHGEKPLCDLGGFAPKLRPENVAFIALREVVDCERKRIRDLGLAAYTLADVERRGIAR